MEVYPKIFPPQQIVQVQQALPLQQSFHVQQVVSSSQQLAMVIFLFNGMQTRIQCLINEKMRDIINRFNTKLKINMNNAQYLYGGNQVNLELTFYQQASIIDKQRKEMIILVYINESIISNNQSTIKSKEIICPKCKENCLISFDNYQIKLYNCKNGHEINNISLKDFNNSQNINENEIKCNNCNNTKYKSYNKQFYKCLNCNIHLCPLCNQKHDKSHEVIDYNNINYICSYHKDFYISYCKDCKINLCMKCETKHNNHHEIINYKNILPDEDQIKKELKIFKDKIDKLKETFKEVINMLNNIYDNFQKLYKICYDIVYNYNLRQRNYEILANVNSAKDFMNSEDIDVIISTKSDIKNKFGKIYNVFYKMRGYKDLSLKEKLSRGTLGQDNNFNKAKNNLTLIFKYLGNNYTIQATSDMMLGEVFIKFLNKEGLSYDDIYFYHNSSELPNSCRSKTLFELGIQNFFLFDVVAKWI